MKKLFTIAMLGTVAGTAAYAGSPTPAQQDPVVYQAAPLPVSNDWAGGYVGGQLGYAYGDFDLNLNNFNNDSVIGGINAGYLWSLGNGWYMGPEFQYDWADLSVTDPATGNSATFNEIARLKLIAGYEMGRGMLYGTLGYAYANFDGVGTFFDGSDGSYVIGVGYDYKVTDNWAIGAEYMNHSFKGIGNAGGDVDLNTVHVKATYRF